MTRAIRLCQTIAARERGLSLLEAILAMAILLMILPLIFLILTYASTAFGTGEEQADLQQNLRLVADHVNDKIRYAEEIDVRSDIDEGGSGDDSYEYLFIDEDGYLVHRIDDEDRRHLSKIGDRIDLNLSFHAEKGSELLQFTASGTQRLSGREHDLSSDIRLLNTVPNDQASGEVIKFRSPVPPAPSIRGMQLLHPDTGESNSYHFEDQSGDEATVRAKIVTYDASDDAELDLTVTYPEDPDFSANVDIDPMPPETAFHSDTVEFTVEFDADNPPGTYKIKGILDDDLDIVARSYVIRPTFRVTGTVTDPDASGIADACVRLDGDTYDFEEYELAAESNPDGTFDICNVPADDYEVRISHDEHETWTGQQQIVDEDVEVDVELTPEEESN